MRKINHPKCIHLIALVLFAMLIIASCKKYHPMVPPAIYFDKSPGYVFGDTTIKAGSTITIGVRTQSRPPGIPLMRLIHWAGSTTQIIDNPDTTKDKFSFNFVIQTGNLQGEELHEFRIYDRRLMSSDIALTLKLK